MTREQVRAKNKESLQEIIDNDKLSEEQKSDAVAQMVAMTDLMEKEVAAETLLASKGFSEAVVSLSEDSADVVVNAKELSDASRAQIEDIITRKTGVAREYCNYANPRRVNHNIVNRVKMSCFSKTEKANFIFC